MRLPHFAPKIVWSRILFVVVTGASISLSQAEDQNALHKECFRQSKGRSCVRLGTSLWQDPQQRNEARAAFAKGCQLKVESACTLKDMGMPAAGESAKSQEGKLDGIEMTSPTNYRVSRKVIAKYASDLETTLSTAEMTKQKSDGKVVGYRFKSIDSESIFAALGFLKEDVILRVNDQTIATPEDAMTLLPSLLYGSADQYVVQMSRGGLVSSRRYDIVK